MPGTNSTQREHLASIFPDDPRLKSVPLGPWEEYIFAVFWAMYYDRQFDAMSAGVGPITMRMMLDYQQLYHDCLNIDEIEVLQALDDAFLKTKAELKENG